MKNTYRMSWLSPVLAAGALSLSALLLFDGCSTEPVEDFTVSISPQTVEIKKDESVTFVASGGVRYEWTLGSTSNTPDDATDPWGILSATTGEHVTYKSMRSPEDGEEYVVRTITVTATLGLTGASNSAPRTATTTAYIYHIP